jgi:Skp family chaperone for outer membrane proteins
MKKLIVIVSFLLFVSDLSAQKGQKVAWYDQDAVIAAHPVYHSLEDSIAHFNEVATLWLNKNDSTIKADSAALARDSASYSPQILALKKKELQLLKDNRIAFIDAVKEENLFLKEILYANLKATIQTSAENVAARKGYKIVYPSLPAAVAANPKGFDAGRDNITDLVFVECKVAKPLGPK